MSWPNGAVSGTFAAPPPKPNLFMAAAAQNINLIFLGCL